MANNRSRQPRGEANYPATAPYRSLPRGRRRVRVPDQVRQIYVPLSVLEATSRIMGRFGRERRECYVWWGGYFTVADAGQVTSAFCPDIPTEFGHIHLDLSDFASLHEELRQRDQILIAELHTHPPGAGGQNAVDAAHPAAPYPGFISIVVPDFAYPFLHDLRRCYVYQYAGAGQWDELSAEEVEQKFTIDETMTLVARP
jgi:hypothetical protein